MKKICFILITFFLAGAAIYGQMPGDIESLVPADANLFIKTREVSKIVKTLNYIVFSLMDEQEKNEAIAARDKFRDKTGIDYLDEKSLLNAGIDTSRPVSYANFNKDTSDEVMVVFVPVLNEKDAPLNFIELVKKNSVDKPSQEINVVTVLYKSITVYQITKDMFTASINGYFLIASTGDILRRIIDIKISRSGSLILDDKYRDYIAKGKSRHELNAFITKDFFSQIGAPTGRSEKFGYDSTDDIILVQKESFDKSSRGSFFDSIDYVAAGLSLDGNKLQVSASVKLASNNPYVDMIMGFIKTGVQKQSLYVPLADTNMFMSMNLTYLDNLCKGEIDWCANYNNLKQQIRTGYGIDIEKDFIPYYSGGINIVSVDSGAYGGVGDLFVFVPMNDAKKIEEMWGKIKKGMKAKYGPMKRFGEEKIGNKYGFWYIDESRMRFFISYDQRGIYAGNNSSFMKSGINSQTVGTAVNTGRYGNLINENTFLFLNIKKNAFVKAMMQMRAQGNAGFARGINRLGEMFVYCEKKDGSISADVELEIKDPGNKK